MRITNFLKAMGFALVTLLLASPAFAEGTEGTKKATEEESTSTTAAAEDTGSPWSISGSITINGGNLKNPFSATSPGLTPPPPSPKETGASAKPDTGEGESRVDASEDEATAGETPTAEEVTRTPVRDIRPSTMNMDFNISRKLSPVSSAFLSTGFNAAPLADLAGDGGFAPMNATKLSLGYMNLGYATGLYKGETTADWSYGGRVMMGLPVTEGAFESGSLGSMTMVLGASRQLSEDSRWGLKYAVAARSAFNRAALTPALAFEVVPSVSYKFNDTASFDMRYSWKTAAGANQVGQSISFSVPTNVTEKVQVLPYVAFNPKYVTFDRNVVGVRLSAQL